MRNETKCQETHFFTLFVWNTVNIIEDGIDRVVIPELQFQLSNEHLQQLREEVNPTAESSNYGISEYMSVLEFIHIVVSANPTFYQQWIS